ncbi:MAG: alpha/beta fold hydrolase [Desulfocurvibacter africanus]
MLDFSARSSNGKPMDTLLMLLLIPLVAAFIFGLLSYTFYWYEVASSPHRAVFERAAAGHPWRLFAQLMMLSSIAQLAAYASVLLGLWPGMYRPSPGQRKTDAGAPVIFVHGLYHSAGGWIAIRRRFLRAGVRNLYAITYNSLRDGVPDISQQLAQRMREVLAAHPGRKVFLVGHSTGGLVIRMTLTDPEIAAHVAGVVTLGAPHHGSKLAALGVGRTARDLLWGGEFIRRLNAMPQPDLPVLSLYTEFDNMVLPPEAARIPAGAIWREEAVGLSSHVGLLFNRKATELVLAFYRERHNRTT